MSLGLLCALTRSAGFQCDVLQPNIFLSALMGCNSYEHVANTPALFGVAEHLFSVDIFGTEALSSDSYLSHVADISSDQPQMKQSFFMLRDRLIPELLDSYTQEILRRKPKLVGFTCTFNQVMASVALARRIKRVTSEIQIVLGGPCVHSEMGVCYSRIFQDCIDAVFLGEADSLFPEYLSRLFDTRGLDDLPGIARRGSHLPATALFEDLDALPMPNYSHYFDFRRDLETAGFSLAPFECLPFEGSRGCWWGQKRHCTFCGLNNEGMRYRRKSPVAIQQELTSLADLYGTTNFMAADNILDYRGYRELLPQLQKIDKKLSLFFEIKTNVTRNDVNTLASSGVTWVQPGIESFSDHVLELMRKGATALQNVQTLKWLSEFGIRISYNLLVGFPRETDADYAEILSFVAKLRHLPAPGPEAHIVQVQRFAPFYFSPSDYDIGPIQGASYYDHLIPPAVANKDEYAYFFDREIADSSPVHRNLETLNARLKLWHSSERTISLRLERRAAKLVTTDRETQSHRDLGLLSSVILVLCDEAIGQAELFERLTALGSYSQSDVADALRTLEGEDTLVKHHNRVLSLIPFQSPQSVAALERWLLESTNGRISSATPRARAVQPNNPMSDNRLRVL